jgi:hypothetical protein
MNSVSWRSEACRNETQPVPLEEYGGNCYDSGVPCTIGIRDA